MSDIKVTVSVEVIGPSGITFSISDQTLRHVGDNPSFLAGEIEDDINHVGSKVMSSIMARFGDVRKQQGQ